ncbi:hypothetical protein CANARDRAFT_6305 [[Candida] arabinofermentans NRRL YB-2248]|uniref:TauD/TfdA-like domain-containing protein n=1 Tax=[Candida] arabinofermentans NRRL YB-2248 TaxID=983967 RepID=A0A1E4T4N7_9ASCO|nr:hypothetical protein CANARDRAFT_6305 [[Candida] arabinofermentans NRRL YB-2248]
MSLAIVRGGNETSFIKNEDSIKDGVLSVAEENLKRLKHPEFAPTWDLKHEQAFKHLPASKHVDRGYFGDPSFENLFAGVEAKHKPITPKFGSVVKGVQLSQLTPQQKDDLALFVEQRGVAVFRGQDFKHLKFDEIKEWGRYFGPLHVHPTSGAPLNQPEFHIVLRRGKQGQQKRTLANKLNSMVWHTDTSYEPQPPAITLFGMLQTDVGGDTQFIDTIEAYERLSPTFQKQLEGLYVLHTSREQANNAKAGGGIERKAPIDSIHPLVRFHPVLKKKLLYINRGFTRKILGLKDQESANLLNFLFQHIESCLDAHIRANWDENTIVIWDNRRVVHSATLDWDSDSLRHAFRVTTLGERPIASEEQYNDWDPENDQFSREKVDEINSLTPAEYHERFPSLK